MKIYIHFLILALGFGLISSNDSSISTSDINPQDATTSNISKQTKSTEPPIVDYNVTKDNVTCILAAFAAKIDNFSSGNGTSSNTTIIINGTVDYTASMCDDSKNILAITVGDGEFRMFFEKANQSIQLYDIIWNNSPDDEYRNNDTWYTISEGHTFKCGTGFEIPLKNQNGKTAHLTIKSMRINAFRKHEAGEKYEPETTCEGEAAMGSKMIPIIIAIVLGAMVVIMLIGYIVLRRKEDKSAYQSV